MFGVKTLLTKGWSEDSIFVPSGFFTYAWNLFLPHGTCSVLLSIMTFIIHGYTKTEIVELMKAEEKELSLLPFSFEIPKSFECEQEKERFFAIYERELAVRHVLHRSHFKYPKTMIQWIHLLIQVGILREVRKGGKIYLDMIVHPFPLPEDVLMMDELEVRQIHVYRKQAELYMVSSREESL